MPKPEVLLIGIDGATFDLIDPWVELLADCDGLCAAAAREQGLRVAVVPMARAAWAGRAGAACKRFAPSSSTPAGCSSSASRSSRSSGMSADATFQEPP